MPDPVPGVAPTGGSRVSIEAAMRARDASRSEISLSADHGAAEDVATGDGRGGAGESPQEGGGEGSSGS